MPDHQERPGLAASLAAATQFLTLIPAGDGHDHPLARSVMMFPVVGAAIGLAGALFYIVAAWLGLGPALAAIACVVAMLVLTRGLHEDGLADLADGLGAHTDREGRLAIMRDSRIGVFGAMALIIVIGARVAAVAELQHAMDVLAALVVAAALSRAFMVVAMRTMPDAREDGMAAAAGRTGIRSGPDRPWRRCRPGPGASLSLGVDRGSGRRRHRRLHRGAGWP